MGYVVMYLAAIVAANLTVAHFGQPAVIVNAFLLIGLDLTARDKLHESWRHNHLALRMSLLVGSGSLLSWILNRGAGTIALASFVAFALAGVVDTIVYHALSGRSQVAKINSSNIMAAAVDSVVFPTIAFGAFIPALVLGQYAAKVAGGWAWALVISRRTRDV